MSPQSAKPRRRNIPLLTAVVGTIAACALLAGHKAAVVTIPGLDAAELLTVDARLRLRGARAPVDDRIVIVGFDDKLRRRWPEVFQQRAGWARFIDSLQAYKPKAVAIDALFASPEIPLPEGVVDQVRRAHRDLTPADIAASTRVAAAHRALAAVVDATRGDRLLAKALRRSGPVVLALLFFLDNGEEQPLPKTAPEPVGLAGAQFDEAVALDNDAVMRPPRAEADVYVSLPEIATAASFAGALNVLRDDDGKVRRVPAAVEHGGRFYATLGLAMARQAVDGADLKHVAGERTIGLGDVVLPSDTRGVVTLNPLAGRGAFPVISAADVFDKKVAAERLAGKLVFVGYTDAARDRVATPLADAVPGVELHATLTHNALHGELLDSAGPTVGLLVLLLLGLMLTMSQLRAVRGTRTWIGSAVAIVGVGGWIAVAQVALGQGLLLEVAGPVLGTTFIALCALTAALATEGREKARLRRAFGQYVSRSLVNKIAEDPGRVTLGGVRRELTVLFSDIRGFSGFSEGMQPEALSEFLNEYLTPMSEEVLDRGGMLDKYIGDAVMAVYGAPLPMDDHVEQACASALGMVGRLDDLNAGWAARGLPQIHIGVGLNTGAMSVGNMGSEQRFDYTVLGDEVNLAARLEALTKEYGTAILLGPKTADVARRRFVVRELDRVRVKGRASSAAIYDLLGEKGSCVYTERWLDAYALALAAYREGRWDEASSGFTKLAQERPEDGACAIMLGRIANLRDDPPGDDWDGVYEQRSK